MHHLFADGRLARWALCLTRLGLAFYLLLFPWGQALREIGSGAAFAGLVLYYLLDWRGSVLARFPLRRLYFVFWAFVLFKVFHSVHMGSGLYALEHNFDKGPALLLAALESVRRPRDLRRAALLVMAMGLGLGLHGSWDLFHIGSIPDKRFGNLHSLILPAFFCLPVLLPRRWGRPARWGVTLAAALPGLTAWVGSQARSGWFGLLAAVFGYVWMRWGPARAALLAGIILAGLFAYRPGIISPSAIMADARWEIWSVAVMEFKSHPWLGVGANAFEPAYKAMGYEFDPKVFDLPVPHPHNVYLQFLAETGLIGLGVFLAFALGMPAWAARRIRAHMAVPRPDAHWIATACFWSSYLGYLMTAVSAHNFFRTWWLGMAMTMLGLALGGCMALENPLPEDPPRTEPLCRW